MRGVEVRLGILSGICRDQRQVERISKVDQRGFSRFLDVIPTAAEFNVKPVWEQRLQATGIGTALVRQMQEETASGYSLQIINIERSLNPAMTFFRNRGFYERLGQYEMLKPF